MQQWPYRSMEGQVMENIPKLIDVLGTDGTKNADTPAVSG